MSDILYDIKKLRHHQCIICKRRVFRIGTPDGSYLWCRNCKALMPSQVEEAKWPRSHREKWYEDRKKKKRKSGVSKQTTLKNFRGVK